MRFDLGTSDVDGNDGKDGANADKDEVKEVPQADDRSTQNVEDCGHYRFDVPTGDVDGCGCEYCDDEDADEEE